MCAGEIPFLTEVVPGNVYGTLTLDVTDDLRNGVLWRYRYQHVHMVRHHMAFKNLTLSTASQVPYHLPQILA